MTAYRLRWVLLVLALTCLAGSLWWIAGPFLHGELNEGSTRAVPLSLLTGLTESDSDGFYGIHLALFLGMLLLSQWMFLRPRRGWTVRLAESSRPMRTAVVAAALMAMMLSLAWVATLLEWVGLWDDVGEDERWVAIPVIAWIVWLLWTGVFYLHWRKGDRFEQLRTMAHGLLVGSVLELIVATGVFLWKSDEDDCWCARGSYTGLVFGATVMIWVFGPGLLFLFLREQRYRRPQPSTPEA